MSKDKTSKIVEYMKEHGSITPMDALNKFHVFRLASIIYNLREHHGCDIDTLMEEGQDADGNKVEYARYIWKGVTANG